MPSSEINGHAPFHSTGDARIDIREETYTSSQEDLKKLQNDSILKRIPHGAEATTVLVCTFYYIGFNAIPEAEIIRLKLILGGCC